MLISHYRFAEELGGGGMARPLTLLTTTSCT
jgi:hypothetical protein